MYELISYIEPKKVFMYELISYKFLATKSVSGKDFKDLAWDNYILRMKSQETVSKLFDVLVKIFHMKFIL